MVKQIIIVNTGVPMSKGQLAAQVAHASVGYLLNRGVWLGDTFTLPDLTAAELHWMKESFTKIVLKVPQQLDLEYLKMRFSERGLRTYTMIDYDHVTALAVEPTTDDKVDDITKDLIMF